MLRWIFVLRSAEQVEVATLQLSLTSGLAVRAVSRFRETGDYEQLWFDPRTAFSTLSERTVHKPCRLRRRGHECTVREGAVGCRIDIPFRNPRSPRWRVQHETLRCRSSNRLSLLPERTAPSGSPLGRRRRNPEAVAKRLVPGATALNTWSARWTRWPRPTACLLTWRSTNDLAEETGSLPLHNRLFSLERSVVMSALRRAIISHEVGKLPGPFTKIAELTPPNRSWLVGADPTRPVTSPPASPSTPVSAPVIGGLCRSGEVENTRGCRPSLHSIPCVLETMTTWYTNDEERFVRFLHLSDIHFCDCDGPTDTDLNHAVRERMLEDIEKMHGQRGDMDAVLVVGDIAARGKQTDYHVAASFLDRTCERVGVAADHVVCVPGNHDIDRDQQGALHASTRFQLRRIDAREISEVLLGLLREEAGQQILLKPLEAYNEFALRYGCAIDQELLLWKPKILDLGARRLFIHGVNSAWVCDESDSFENDTERAIVGVFQVTPIAQDPSAVSIALCHHPLRWLRDAGIVAPWFARAQVVVTGHEHEAGIEVSGDQRSLWIASGAVNPAQTHAGWIPAYNVVELELTADDQLRVRVFSQCWQSDYAEFGPDQSKPQPFSCDLRLPNVQEVAKAQSAPRSKEPSLSPSSSIVAPEPELFASDEREMLYKVMSASPDVRRRAARQLELLPGGEELVGLALDKEVIRRALASDRLAELARTIHG